MLGKHLALALLGTTLIAAPALAQTNPPAGSTTAPPADSTAAPPAASTTAPASGAMSTGNWMTQEQAGQWRASKLEGLNVYNQNNEKIGDISELIVDSSGKVQAVVVGVGGFLGMGEHDVAIPFDQISLVNEPRAVATTATTNGRTAATDPNAPATPTSPPASNMAATNPNAAATLNAPANQAVATNNAGANNPTTVNTTGTVTTANRDNANRSAPDHAMLKMNMTKDQLKAAPEFKYAR